MSAVARYPHLRRNFALLAIDYIAFGMAYGMVGSNSALLPNFISQLTDNKQIIGLAGAMYTFAWLMPQLIVAQIANRRARRKPFIWPAPFFRLFMIVAAAVISFFAVDSPGLTLVVFLIAFWLFAVGDAIVTLGWSDLLGSSVPHNLRGTLFGASGLAVAVGALLMSAIARWALGPNGPAFPNNYALLFGLAGGIFIVGGIALVMTVEEKADTPHEPGPTFSQYGAFLTNVLRTDRDFRRFIRTRLLLDLATMSVPFYAVFGTGVLGLQSQTIVGDSIILIQMGSASAAVLMGVVSRRSGSRAVIRLAALFIMLEAGFALISYLAGSRIALYGAFFMLGTFGAVAVPSYFDWMITHAPPVSRPIYVGLTNTISALSNLAPLIGGTILQVTAQPLLIGIAALLPSFLGVPVVHVTLYPLVFGTSVVLAFLALLSTRNLYEPRHKAMQTQQAGAVALEPVSEAVS